MVRARGQTIEKAIDTVQMLRRGFIKDAIIKSVQIGSEDVTRFDGTRGNISTIEITLTREGEEEGSEEDETLGAEEAIPS